MFFTRGFVQISAPRFRDMQLSWGDNLLDEPRVQDGGGAVVNKVSERPSFLRGGWMRCAVITPGRGGTHPCQIAHYYFLGAKKGPENKNCFRRLDSVTVARLSNNYSG